MCRFESKQQRKCANFLLTLFVANNACYLIGLAFYKGNNQKHYFMCAQCQGQSVPDCMYCNQHFGCLAIILEKTICCFFLSRVKVQLVVCANCDHHHVCLAFISETSLCFLSSRTKAQFVVYAHCNQHQAALPSVNLQSPLLELHSILQRTHRTTLQRTQQNTQDHIVRTHQKTKRNTTQKTHLPAAAPPWCHRSIMPNVRVGLFQLLDAGPSLAMAGRDIGWAAFDQRQGQIQPIPDGVHTYPV